MCIEIYFKSTCPTQTTAHNFIFNSNIYLCKTKKNRYTVCATQKKYIHSTKCEYFWIINEWIDIGKKSKPLHKKNQW